MLGNLNGWHLIILLAVILLLFGAARLPALAKSIGQSARVFRGEMKQMRDEDEPEGESANGGQRTSYDAAAAPKPDTDRSSGSSDKS